MDYFIKATDKTITNSVLSTKVPTAWFKPVAMYDLPIA